MNHFIGLAILAVCIAGAFALVNKEKKRERIHYFLTLLAYMILGSLVFSWLMYLVP